MGIPVTESPVWPGGEGDRVGMDSIINNYSSGPFGKRIPGTGFVASKW